MVLDKFSILVKAICQLASRQDLCDLANTYQAGTFSQIG